MHDALVFHNKYACHKMMGQFGLISCFVSELDRSYIEEFLDSRVTEVGDHNTSEFEIDYGFMKRGYWECILISLAKYTDNSYIVTHPVIRIYVDCIMKQFERLHILNMLLYLALFVLPSFFGYFFSDFTGYLASTIFLSLRELFQYLFIKRLNCHREFEMKELHNKNEKFKLREKFIHRRFFKTFFMAKTNIFESFLILITALTTVSLFLGSHPDIILTADNIFEKVYRVMLVILILMGTIELSILTTSVYSNQGIYLVSMGQFQGRPIRDLKMIFTGPNSDRKSPIWINSLFVNNVT
jgi:hypothetical protein